MHAQRLKSRPAAMSALFELAADDELESVQP
jgi:hypothetical protein